MSSRSDRYAPAAVVLATLAVAAVIVVLLTSAVSSGRDALEDSLLAEVEAVARSQDQRITSTLTGTAGLAAQPFELEEGSADDLERLEELLALVPDLRTGFFLTDADMRITQGVQLLEDSSIGTRYERPGFDELAAGPGFARGVGGILTVGDGLTTGSPTVAIVFPILDPRTGAVRGSFVFESEVAADSDLNTEIRELSRGDTGQYLFFDDNGRVLAANEDSLIADTVPDELLTGRVGLQSLDGDIVVIQDVPSAGWRIAFRQDRDEFESGLAGPIQVVGAVVVVVLLAVGAAAAVLVLRRLRAAREEQARLRRLAESQEEFVSIVSHELRTPVAGVLGFLQTTLDHWDTMGEEERHNAVRRAATNARRLQALTRDVLDSEALESGRMSFVFDRIDLAEEVRNAVEAADALYEDRAIELEVPGDPVLVTADGDRIHQVLTNLIDNALQNAPPTEPVLVRLQVNDGRAAVEVEDRGPGLPDEVAARAFDKFVRGRADRVGGTGLGLYIARSIVEAHHGTIDVRSTPGTGATFTVELPLEPGDRAPQEATGSGTARASTDTAL